MARWWRTMTDSVKLWTDVYEYAGPNKRPSDIDATAARAENEVAFHEKLAEAVEAHLAANALPSPLPDMYANLRGEPTRLRVEGARWQALRDRIRNETGR